MASVPTDSESEESDEIDSGESDGDDLDYDDSGDEDYIPDVNEVESNEIEEIEQDLREELAIRPEISLLSKCKNIQYSLEPLSNIGRNIEMRGQPGNLFLYFLCSYEGVLIFFSIQDRRHMLQALLLILCLHF